MRIPLGLVALLASAVASSGPVGAQTSPAAGVPVPPEMITPAMQATLDRITPERYLEISGTDSLASIFYGRFVAIRLSDGAVVNFRECGDRASGGRYRWVEPEAVVPYPAVTDCQVDPIWVRALPADAPTTFAASGAGGTSVAAAGGRLVSDLAGAVVYGSDAVAVGEIAGVVEGFDETMLGAVVDIGGFLGMGSRQVAIPLDRITFSGEGAELQALGDATAAELGDLPAIELDAMMQAPAVPQG